MGLLTAKSLHLNRRIVAPRKRPDQDDDHGREQRADRYRQSSRCSACTDDELGPSIDHGEQRRSARNKTTEALVDRWDLICWKATLRPAYSALLLYSAVSTTVTCSCDPQTPEKERTIISAGCHVRTPTYILHVTLHDNLLSSELTMHDRRRKKRDHVRK